MKEIIKAKLKIEGMHCSACALDIDFDLEDLNGVKTAKTSYARSETEVEFDFSEVKIEEIIAQINKTGYTSKQI